MKNTQVFSLALLLSLGSMNLVYSEGTTYNYRDYSNEKLAAEQKAADKLAAEQEAADKLVAEQEAADNLETKVVDAPTKTSIDEVVDSSRSDLREAMLEAAKELKEIKTDEEASEEVIADAEVKYNDAKEAYKDATNMAQRSLDSTLDCLSSLKTIFLGRNCKIATAVVLTTVVTGVAYEVYDKGVSKLFDKVKVAILGQNDEDEIDAEYKAVLEAIESMQDAGFEEFEEDDQA